MTINEWLSIDKTSGEGDSNITLTAPPYGGDGIRTTKFVVKGRYRSKEVNVSQISKAFLKKKYLWMEFEEEGGEVQFHYGFSVIPWDEGVIEYSFNGLYWESYQIECKTENEVEHIIEMGNNKIIYFRKKSGTINTDLAGLKVNYNVGGDITSVMERDVLREGVRFSKNSLTFNPEIDGNDKLIDASALIYPYDLTGYSFANQFHSCVSLINPPVLHSMILEGSCYSWMFKYCTSLKTAPELPATELKDSCYLGMFQGCTSLVNAPELPATTLAESTCYGQMFMDCTSLVNPPALPATVLQPRCYWSMFSGCTSLITTPEMVIEGYVSNPYVEGFMGYMFAGCTSLKTAPITINTYRVHYNFCPNMFAGCTSLKSSPELNSESLSEGCYVNMFKGCSSLSYIKMLGKKIEGYGETLLKCLGSWVDGVASTGIFVKSKDMNRLPTGKDGIPTGWQVYNEQAPIEPDEPDEPDEPTEPEVPINDYFWVEFEETNGVIKFLNETDQLDMYHSFDGGVVWQKTPTTLSMGNRKLVHFKNNSLVLNSLSKQTWIDFTKYASIGGNLGALTNMDSYCCANLFLQNTHLINADELRVHSTLASNCYYQMFYGCTSLKTAPELPATILADGCYRYMFFGCSSLTTAPVLPASELVRNCYRYMFNGCLNLSLVECYAEDISAEGCLNRWLQNVTLRGTFIKKEGVTYPSGESGIPINWSIQEIP